MSIKFRFSILLIFLIGLSLRANAYDIVVENQDIYNDDDVASGSIEVGLGVNVARGETVDSIDNALYKNNRYSYMNSIGDDEELYIRGGIIYNEGTIGIKNGEVFEGDAIVADFLGNSVYNSLANNVKIHVNGGVIDNKGEIGNIVGKFDGNYVEGHFAWGGAIFNETSGEIQQINSDFENNYAKGHDSGGGAIVNEGNIAALNGNFVGNYVETDNYAVGGAIHNNDRAEISLINGNFYDNYAKGNDYAYGGAVDNLVASIGIIDGDFKNNKAISTEEGLYNVANAGAISNQNSSIESISGDFEQNVASALGGSAYGGAIYNFDASILSITGTFQDNRAEGKYEALGGVVYSHNSDDSKELNFVNASFYNNSAVASDGEAFGGAIYANNVSIKADGVDSKFSGNTANGVSNAIFMNGGTLSLISENGGNIVFDDGIDGQYLYNIDINGGGTDIDRNVLGEVVFNNSVKNVNNFVLQNDSNIHLGVDADIQVENYQALGNNVLTLDYSSDVALNTIKNGVIRVNNDVTGNTEIIVNSLDSKVFSNPSAVKSLFVSAPQDDLDTESNFSVLRVMRSPYMWDAVRNANGETEGSYWYLSLSGSNTGDDDNSSGGNGNNNGSVGEYFDMIYTPEVNAYVGLQAAALEQNRDLSSKIGAALDAYQYQNCCGRGRKYPVHNNGWVKADYSYAKIENKADMKARIASVMGGIDFGANYYHRLGVFGAYRQGIYDLNGKGALASNLGSKFDIDSYVGGLYYRYHRNRFQATMMLYGGKEDISLKTDDNLVKIDNDALIYGAGLELAKQFYLPKSWVVSPELGLYWQAVDVDKFSDDFGKTAEFDVMHYMEAEFGLRLEYLYCSHGEVAKFYIKPSVVQTYTAGNRVKITNLKEVNTYKNQALGRLEVGFKYGFSAAISAYTMANITKGDGYESYGADAGLIYSW